VTPGATCCSTRQRDLDRILAVAGRCCSAGESRQGPLSELWRVPQQVPLTDRRKDEVPRVSDKLAA
jgi:hypothetical protein